MPKPIIFNPIMTDQKDRLGSFQEPSQELSHPHLNTPVVTLSPTPSTTPADIEELGDILSSFEWTSDDLIETSSIPSDPRMALIEKKGLLSVTDLSAQIWCEEQIIQKYIHGKEPDTIAKLEGSHRHMVLELIDHDVKEVRISSKAEALAFRLLNSITLIEKLLTTGETRELWVLGWLNLPNHPSKPHWGIRGVIDELKITKYPNSCTPKFHDGIDIWQSWWLKHHCQLSIGDTKTRREEVEPSLAQKLTSSIQLQTYHLLITLLRDGRFGASELAVLYGVDASVILDHSELGRYQNGSVNHLLNHYILSCRKLPPLTSYAEVIYDCKGKIFARNSIPCDTQMTIHQVEYLLSFWSGTRETIDLPLHSERWKCKFCHYLPFCQKTPLKDKERCDAIKLRNVKVDENKRLVEVYLAKQLSSNNTQEPVIPISEDAQKVSTVSPQTSSSIHRRPSFRRRTNPRRKSCEENRPYTHQ